MVIDADCILANLLRKHEQVTVRELNRVRAAIERKLSGVYVDVTTNCLVWAANQRPEMFVLDNSAVRRVKQWSQCYVDQFFNYRIPSDIRASVLETLSSDGWAEQ